MQRNNEITPLALEFLQKKCYDGVLNYKCEYKVEVELMNREGKISKLLGHDEVMKDSFVVYADVPNDTTSLKVTVKEMDENEVSATSQFVLENVHGENMQIQSSDDTFKGVFTVKHINYDETQEHSEGDEDFKPHDQDKRASKKLFELRMP